ncbi:MAG: hypothetical protein H7839_15510 [Magnetococcus sp. YQC-5]
MVIIDVTGTSTTTNDNNGIAGCINERYHVDIDRLSPTVQVALGSVTVTLEKIIQALHTPDVPYYAEMLSSKAQERLGEFLWDRAFGATAQAKWEDVVRKRADIRILSSSDHVAGLPWPLLGRQGRHAVLSGSTVSQMIPGVPLTAAVLPPLPKVMLVAPEPKGCEPTGSHQHVQEIAALLKVQDPRYEPMDRLRIVSTWKDFFQEVASFQPHVFYFYGHGNGDARDTVLWFEEEDGTNIPVPMKDIANALNRVGSPPILAYINACYGADTGYLGAGWQLGPIVPVVIANRTLVKQKSARPQGMQLLVRVLVDGAEPLQAVGRLYDSYVERGELSDTIYWLTPAVYCHYSSWHSSPLDSDDSRKIADAHWHCKLDRVFQFSRVNTDVIDLLRYRSMRGRAFGWYGSHDQGAEMLLDRLRVEFEERLDDAKVFPVRPSWPLIAITPLFEAMLCRTFNVKCLSEISNAVLSHPRMRTETKVLIYIHNDVIQDDSSVMTPAAIKTYLDFLDVAVLKNLHPRIFVLSGFAFNCINPDDFYKRMSSHGLLTYRMSTSRFELLPELLSVTEDDIINFIQSHGVPVPPTRWEKVAASIIRKTNGRYEATIRALEDVVKGYWDLAEDPLPNTR